MATRCSRRRRLLGRRLHQADVAEQAASELGACPCAIEAGGSSRRAAAERGQEADEDEPRCRPGGPRCPGRRRRPGRTPPGRRCARHSSGASRSKPRSPTRSARPSSVSGAPRASVRTKRSRQRGLMRGERVEERAEIVGREQERLAVGADRVEPDVVAADGGGAVEQRREGAARGGVEARRRRRTCPRADAEQRRRARSRRGVASSVTPNGRVVGEDVLCSAPPLREARADRRRARARGAARAARGGTAAPRLLRASAATAGAAAPRGKRPREQRCARA